MNYWRNKDTSIDFCEMNYWGNKDTSISFCESKYSEVFWIAEYYNTISSFMYIFAALPFLNGKNKKVALSCVGVGIGSIMLHGTMRSYGQWVDEISMLLFSYYSLKTVKPHFPDLAAFLCFSFNVFIYANSYF
jgi:hypothetical protein